MPLRSSANSHVSQGELRGTRSTQRASNPEHQRYQQLCTQRHVAQAAEEEMNPSLATRWNDQQGHHREP
jgi:uncharacterized protein HemY